jgi:hypothetical protein
MLDEPNRALVERVMGTPFDNAFESVAIGDLNALLNAAREEGRAELFEIAAQAVYEQWSDQDGYVPWSPCGNSTNQCEARRIVHRLIPTAPYQQETKP